MTTQRYALLAGLISLCMMSAPIQADPLTFEPDSIKSRSGEVMPAERATLWVPENRKIAGSRKIPLRFVRLRSTNPNPGLPIVYLAGGPGGSAVGAAQGPRFNFFKSLRSLSDVILLEQRGTGLSNTIPPCKAPQRFDFSKPLDRASVTAFVRAATTFCMGFWRTQGVDMRGYNTRESAADVEELRKAIGAPKLNLVGISYGTHLGLAVLKYYGNSIDKVAFTGMEGLDQTVKRPADFDAFFMRVGQAVDSDPQMRAMVPDLVGLMRRVHERLDTQAPLVGVKRGDGSVVNVRLTAYPIQFMTAFFLIKNPQDIAKIPLTYLALDAGMYEQVAQQVVTGMEAYITTMSGMPEVMDLASGISPAQMRLIDEQARVAILSDVANFPMPHIAGIAPEFDLGEEFRAPFKTNTPALIIMGSLDGRTSIESQMRTVSTFTNSHRIIVINGGHDIFEQSEDVQAEILNFFRTGRAARQTIALPQVRFALPPSR